MHSRRIQLVNVRGLHARAAARFVEVVQDNDDISVTVAYDGRSVCGKSLMGLMMLGARQGSYLDIGIKGPNSEETLNLLCRLIENKFGEAS